MDKIEFRANPDGKLLHDYFGTVRMPNPDKYFLGNKLEVIHKGDSLGIAEVVAVGKFDIFHDTHGYMTIRRPVAELVYFLSQCYDIKEGVIGKNVMFNMVVLQYIQRNIAIQQILHDEWWNNILKKSNQPQS